MKSHTIALVISKRDSSISLIEILHDDLEIQFLENALQKGHLDPLEEIYQTREKTATDEEIQGNQMEELVSRPFVKPRLIQQSLLWFRSKIKLEKHRKAEHEAVQVIADYALKIFSENPDRIDFFLEGRTSKLRVRIIPLNQSIT